MGGIRPYQIINIIYLIGLTASAKTAHFALKAPSLFPSNELKAEVRPGDRGIQAQRNPLREYFEAWILASAVGQGPWPRLLGEENSGVLTGEA
jgi:hypothetical protein